MQATRTNNAVSLFGELNTAKAYGSAAELVRDNPSMVAIAHRMSLRADYRSLLEGLGL